MFFASSIPKVAVQRKSETNLYEISIKISVAQVIFRKSPTLTLFRMGIFRAAHVCGRRGGKKAHSLKSVTHRTMMKLGRVIPLLKEDLKKI